MQHLTTDFHGPLQCVDYGGEGQLVLLVHGLGGSGINWMETGEELSKYGKVIAPDLPGFGRSPPAGRSPKIKDQADFLAEFIKWKTDQPAIVVGNSMGALTSIVLAARNPELVEKLILIDPPAPGGDLGSLNRWWIFIMLIYLVPGLNKALLSLMYRQGTPEQRAEEAIAVLTGHGVTLSPDVKRLHMEIAIERSRMPWVYRTHFSAFRSIMALLVPAWKFDRMVSKIVCPTLLMHGTADSVVPFRAAQRLARTRPDWKFVPLVGGGHIAMLETPRLFLDLVAEFLRTPAPTQR